MFYDQFETLCKQTRERPYTLARQLGVASSSIISQWKKGSVPRQPMLEKIAEHFNVTIDYLLTGEQKQPAVPAGLSEKDQRLIAWFRSLPEEKQKAILILQAVPALPCRCNGAATQPCAVCRGRSVR